VPLAEVVAGRDSGVAATQGGGEIGIILLGARMPHVLGWFELAASTIPIGDAIIVLRSNGPKATVYGVHGATAVALRATAALLFT
jgi:Domain of unknown function (DUF4267)